MVIVVTDGGGCDEMIVVIDSGYFVRILLESRHFAILSAF